MTEKPQLTDDQRQQLRAAVVQSVRHALSRREQLQDQARTARQVWQALVAAPTWSIAMLEKPGPTPDEIWSMTPTVTKP